MSGVPLHFIAIVVLVATAGSKVGGFFGVQDPTAAVFFVSAWMLPLTRLKFDPHAAAATTVTQRPTWFLVAGALPWIALPSLHVAFPHSWAWASFAVPEPVRWIGMGLTAVRFCGPFFRSAMGIRSTGRHISLGEYALSGAAVVLISTNVFIVSIAAGGMFCLYLSERNRNSLRVADAIATHLLVEQCAWQEGCQPVS